MIVYKTINLINDKFYIGQDNHNDPNYLGSGLLLNRAIKKYGRKNFKKEMIEKCISKEHLNKREIYWIDKLNATNKKIGYNIAKGGTGGDTMSHNPNKKIIFEKLIPKLRGQKRSEEFCLMVSRVHKGKKLSEKTKRKIKKNHADFSGSKHPSWGLKRSEKTRKKLRDVWAKRKGVYVEA